MSKTTTHPPLCEFVMTTLSHYFSHLEGEKPTNLYNMVIKEVEKGFLKVVMQEARGNQCLAAKMCGMSRNTLRKKLKEHQLDKI
ncbi:MAG TPA: helix-turn-helix domain-containing protein [Gammaproteobacteria bacterium]|nr:helix-turn-helix domain-containing protein [Gammaproteobacteria bacterium]